MENGIQYTDYLKLAILPRGKTGSGASTTQNFVKIDVELKRLNEEMQKLKARLDDELPVL